MPRVSKGPGCAMGGRGRRPTVRPRHPSVLPSRQRLAETTFFGDQPTPQMEHESSQLETCGLLVLILATPVAAYVRVGLAYPRGGTAPPPEHGTTQSA